MRKLLGKKAGLFSRIASWRSSRGWGAHVCRRLIMLTTHAPSPDLGTLGSYRSLWVRERGLYSIELGPGPFEHSN